MKTLKLVTLAGIGITVWMILTGATSKFEGSKVAERKAAIEHTLSMGR